MTEDFEFHVFELPKFHPESDNVRELPVDQKWLYLFTNATKVKLDILSDLLNDEPFREAIGVLEMISKTPEDYQYYEDRLKYLRDQEANLSDAKEEGREEGREEGLEQGLEQGREQGREQGLELGVIAGKVLILQEILGERLMSETEWKQLGMDSLVAKLAELQQRIRERSN